MARVLVLITILIILLGGVYFYENKGGGSSQKEKTASVEQSILSEEAKENNDLQLKNFLPRLFSGFGIKKNQEVLEEDKAEKIEGEGGVPNEKAGSITIELRSKIKNYLIQTSNINFPEDQTKLRLALTQAEEEDALSLIKIRDKYREGLEELKKIEVPEEMKEIHNQSIDIIQGFINLLDDTIHQTKGSVTETWNSEERLDIINKANKVKGDIIEIVERYGIELPADVLPY